MYKMHHFMGTWDLTGYDSLTITIGFEFVNGEIKPDSMAKNGEDYFPIHGMFEVRKKPTQTHPASAAKTNPTPQLISEVLPWWQVVPM